MNHPNRPGFPPGAVPNYQASACFPLSAPLISALDVLVVAPVANPFLLDWVPPGQRPQGPIVPGSGYHDVVSPRVGILQQRGYALHPGDQTNNPQPVGTKHHISIEPRETYPPLGTTLTQEGGIDASVVESLGNRSSILKARIKLEMGNSRQRDFDFDIGAGVEFSVTCYAVLGIDVLIPNPAGPGGVPEDLGPSLTALASIFTTAVYCSPTHGTHRAPLTYTQSFALEGGGEGIDAAVMPVMPAARAVQLFMQDAVSASGVELIFGFTPTFPIVPALGAPTFPVVPVGSAAIPAGQSNTSIVLIPGDANVMMIRGAAGSVTGTIVQTLNV